MKQSYVKTLFPFLFFSPTPSVSWLRKDGEMSESRISKDMYDRRLRFSNISETDSGEYQCIANNSQGKITHTYTVTVEGTSHTLIQILRIYYIAGEIRTSTCPDHNL